MATGIGKTSVRKYFYALFLSALVFAIGAENARAEKRLITLTVTDGEIDFNGVKYAGWLYNGGFPGPEIRVKEGDMVSVKIINKSAEKHGMFFHGVRVTPQVSSDEEDVQIKPGFEYTYPEFKAEPAGTHMYHCSVNMAEHLARGMFGAFIIEENQPKKPNPKAAPYKFNKEYTYILSDWNPAAESTPTHHGIGHPYNLLDLNTFTLNEKVIGSGDPAKIEAKVGDRIKIRLGNLGSLPHKIYLKQGFFVTHDDGYRLYDLKSQKSITIHSGKSNDLLIVVKKPGTYTLLHSINMPPRFRTSANVPNTHEHKGHVAKDENGGHEHGEHGDHMAHGEQIKSPEEPAHSEHAGNSEKNEDPAPVPRSEIKDPKVIPDVDATFLVDLGASTPNEDDKEYDLDPRIINFRKEVPMMDIVVTKGAK